jgi:hypothetical protein
MNAELELGWRVLVMIYDGYDRAQILGALRITAEQALAALDAYARSILER